MGTCTDIDDRKRAQSDLEDRVAERTVDLAQANETLERQRIELQALFDLLPALIWFKDTKNNFLRVNRRVADATGKSPQEIEGRSAVELYPSRPPGIMPMTWK
ncbi:MAG: PAS domain S-box protein [Chthoniobacter sp.]